MLALIKGSDVVDLDLLKSRISARLVALRIPANEASRRAHLGLSYTNDILQGKSKKPHLGRLAQLAEALECDLGYLIGETDEPRAGAHADRGENIVDLPANTRHGSVMVPLYGGGLPLPGGRFSMKGRPIGQAEAAPAIRRIPGAYAVTVLDNHNAPRFMTGEIVHVNPVAPVAIGAFVVCRFNDDTAAIRRLDQIDDEGVILGTLDPNESEEYERSDIRDIHRIVATTEI